MTCKQAFTRSFELYQQGVKHKVSRINGKWTVVVNCGDVK